MPNAIISGADRNIGLELARELLKRGWKVYAGQYLAELRFLDELRMRYPETLMVIPMDVGSSESVMQAVKYAQDDKFDLLIHNAAIFGVPGETMFGKMSFDLYTDVFNINALGAIRLVQAFLPRMNQSSRFCFVSSEAGSIATSNRSEPSAYCMSKAALNMAVRILFNHLQPEGYTFRLYHPGWVRSDRTESSGMIASISQSGKFEPSESAKAGVNYFLEPLPFEDRLVMMDNERRAWSF